MGMVVFARRPGALHSGLYRFSCIHTSSVFNISPDVSESYRAMYRELAVYVRLENNLHFSFVFKQIVNLSVVSSSGFLAKLILHYKEKNTMVFTQYSSLTTVWHEIFADWRFFLFCGN